MDSIKSLFEMHNIKYVVSVDDCFSEVRRGREELEGFLYSQMKSSLTSFDDYLRKSSQKDLYKELLDLAEIGGETEPLLNSLIDNLSQDEIEACVQIGDDNDNDFDTEKTGLLDFLNELKKNECVVDYLTFGSATEAEKYDLSSEVRPDDAVLWLLDRNFARVDESKEAGFQLAENIISRETDNPNYVYIVSDIIKGPEMNEDRIEERFDECISDHCSEKARSFIYYIGKQRLLSGKKDRIAKSLSQGFKRKACYELLQLYCDCMRHGLERSNAIIGKVKQDTLNYLFSQKVKENGESYSDFAARFVQIFQENEYNKAIADKHSEIAEKTRYYEKLVDTIGDSIGNKQIITQTIKDYRQIELYNGHVNAQHAEVTTGDVFLIEEKFYLLVSQACDVYLREDGERKLEKAVLLQIDTHTDKTHIHNHAYPLDIFPERAMVHPAVKFQSFIVVPFELLDLCVYNADGYAKLLLDAEKRENKAFKFSSNYNKRYKAVCKVIESVKESIDIVKKHIDTLDAESKGVALDAFDMLTSVDPMLKRFKYDDCEINYPIQRLFRMKEMVVADIARDYGSAVTRIGHPFDFLKENIADKKS